MNRISKIIVILAVAASTQAIKLHGGEEGISTVSTDQQSQFKALGQKLGLEVTDDMFEGQSPEDVSNAIIGAALEAGKTQDEIGAAMGEPAAAAEE